MFNIEEYINSLPENTRTINVSRKKLTYLPDLSRFTNLQKLICHNNKLTSLPLLNHNLQELSCYSNKLTSLPELNHNLRRLHCCNNKLTSLPELNTNLEVLSCFNNDLTSMPQLNNNLQYLYCYNNKLTSLPKLNNNLQELCCHNNQLISLPKLNENLRTLHCTNNQLTILPELNNNLQILTCSDKLPNFIIFSSNINIQRDSINRLYKCSFRIKCFAYKTHFRRWLWERVRKPKIEKQYSPEMLNLILDTIQDSVDEDDLDNKINNW